jgi:hypothetical protein
VVRLRQFRTGLEQYYSAAFKTALKEAREYAGNSKYAIPLAFKEKRTIRRKKVFLITGMVMNLQQTQNIVSE